MFRIKTEITFAVIIMNTKKFIICLFYLVSALPAFSGKDDENNVVVLEKPVVETDRSLLSMDAKLENAAEELILQKLVEEEKIHNIANDAISKEFTDAQEIDKLKDQVQRNEKIIQEANEVENIDNNLNAAAQADTSKLNIVVGPGITELSTQNIDNLNQDSLNQKLFDDIPIKLNNQPFMQLLEKQEEIFSQISQQDNTSKDPKRAAQVALVQEKFKKKQEERERMKQEKSENPLKASEEQSRLNQEKAKKSEEFAKKRMAGVYAMNKSPDLTASNQEQNTRKNLKVNIKSNNTDSDQKQNDQNISNVKLENTSITEIPTSLQKAQKNEVPRKPILKNPAPAKKESAAVSSQQQAKETEEARIKRIQDLAAKNKQGKIALKESKAKSQEKKILAGKEVREKLKQDKFKASLENTNDPKPQIKQKNTAINNLSQTSGAQKINGITGQSNAKSSKNALQDQLNKQIERDLSQNITNQLSGKFTEVQTQLQDEIYKELKAEIAAIQEKLIEEARAEIETEKAEIQGRLMLNIKNLSQTIKDQLKKEMQQNLITQIKEKFLRSNN